MEWLFPEHRGSWSRHGGFLLSEHAPDTASPPLLLLRGACQHLCSNDAHDVESAHRRVPNHRNALFPFNGVFLLPSNVGPVPSAELKRDGLLTTEVLSGATLQRGGQSPVTARARVRACTRRQTHIQIHTKPHDVCWTQQRAQVEVSFIFSESLDSVKSRTSPWETNANVA